jgi:hypothetical protein
MKQLPLIALDKHLVTAFTHLSNRRCGLGHSDCVAAKAVGLVRDLVDADLADLTTFLKTHH